MIVQNYCCPLCGEEIEFPAQVLVFEFGEYKLVTPDDGECLVCPCGEFGASQAVWRDTDEFLLGEGDGDDR